MPTLTRKIAKCGARIHAADHDNLGMSYDDYYYLGNNVKLTKGINNNLDVHGTKVVKCKATF